uniref:Conserved oligomeric Golgi complex subunit 7 n=1 Tax=Plectus sambesii TaxID=2011161 RepID=A0A914XNC6_9BILA
MDFSRFSDSNFNAKDWINAAFEAPEAQKNREHYAQSLVMKLQLFSQEVHNSLEETSQQIVQTMPRILREVDSMQQEGTLLQNRMKSVQQDVQKVEQETAQAMESLLKIDTAKSRMHSVEKALREIDNWTALTADIDDVFASGNADVMAERLASLQQCLRVLGSKVPDYKERRDFVERLKDQFLAAISPSVVAAFTSQQIDNVLYFAKMFADLDRSTDLEQCYAKCLKSNVSQDWAKLLEDDEGGSAVAVLSALHDSLLSTWFAQARWAETAFKQRAPIAVANALANSLAQLDPSVHSVLDDRLNNAADQLSALCVLRKNCDNLAKSLRQSFSGMKSMNEEAMDTLLNAVYQPIVEFALKYQNYQQSALLDRVNIWNFDDGSLTSNVKNLEESIAAIFGEAQEAVDKCHTFVGDIGLPYLLKALQTYLANYITKAKKILSNPAAFGGGTNEENWDLINSMLSLTSVCGSLLNAMDKLENILLVSYERLLTDWPVERLLDSTVAKGKEDRFEQLLVSASFQSPVQTLYARLGDGTSASAKFLPDIEKQLIKFTNRVIKTTMEQIVGPIASQIEAIPKLPSWSSATVGEALAGDLPTFSLTPQEYITKVGQYLVTFAHHLEPYMSSEDAGMCRALRSGSLPLIDAEEREGQLMRGLYFAS